MRKSEGYSKSLEARAGTLARHAMRSTVLVFFGFWMFGPQGPHRGRDRSWVDLWPPTELPLSFSWAFSVAFLTAFLLVLDTSPFLLSIYLFEGRKLLSSLDQKPKKYLNSTFSFFAVLYVFLQREQCPPKILLPLTDRKGCETRQELVT